MWYVRVGLVHGMLSHARTTVVRITVYTCHGCGEGNHLKGISLLVLQPTADHAREGVSKSHRPQPPTRTPSCPSGASPGTGALGLSGAQSGELQGVDG